MENPEYQIEEEIEKTNEELRNEWLQWIDERSKRYTIEPAIINRLSKNDNAIRTFDGYFLKFHEDIPDVYVYSTPYGLLEFAEQVVENYITKPVDVIIRSRARRKLIFSSLIKKNESYERSILINPRTSPVKDLTTLAYEMKCHYTNLCEDMYETYDGKKAEIDFLPYGRNSTAKLISFDEHTGELCLKIYTITGFRDTEIWKGKDAGQLKFNLCIEESRQQEIIDFVCKGYPYYFCCSDCTKNKNDETEKYEDTKQFLRRQLSDSLKLLSGYQKLTEKFFQINGLEIPKDSTLFLNRKLTSQATPFMKKIRQTLINICIFLKIPVGKLAVNEIVYQAGCRI